MEAEAGEADHHQDGAEVERMTDESVGAGRGELFLLFQRAGGPGADEESGEKKHFADGDERIGPTNHVARAAVKNPAVEPQEKREQTDGNRHAPTNAEARKALRGRGRLLRVGKMSG